MERAGQDVDQFSRYNSTCFIIVAEHGLRKVFETKGIAAWYFYGPAAAENNFSCRTYSSGTDCTIEIRDTRKRDRVYSEMSRFPE